jgi:hypothetical protein
MVRDVACLRLGHNDQSHRGHQCSETMLTGESRFHISSPLRIEPGYLMTGSKWVDHWTSGTVCECEEIACYAQYLYIFTWIWILTFGILFRIGSPDPDPTPLSVQAANVIIKLGNGNTKHGQFDRSKSKSEKCFGFDSSYLVQQLSEYQKLLLPIQ